MNIFHRRQVDRQRVVLTWPESVDSSIVKKSIKSACRQSGASVRGILAADSSALIHIDRVSSESAFGVATEVASRFAAEVKATPSAVRAYTWDSGQAPTVDISAFA